MNYKKKLKSSKKIKGGTIISRIITTKFAAYVLADILMEYYVETYIWCEKFYPNSSTNDYINRFIREYTTDFQNTYHRIIQSHQASFNIQINISQVTMTEFNESIYNKCKELLNWYQRSTSNLDKKLKDALFSILNKLKNTYSTITVSTNSAELNNKLKKMYALHCIAILYEEDINKMKILNISYGIDNITYLPDNYNVFFLQLYDSFKKKFEKNNLHISEFTQYFVDDSIEKNIELIKQNVYLLLSLGYDNTLMFYFISMYPEMKTEEKIRTVIRKLDSLISNLRDSYVTKGIKVFQELYDDTKLFNSSNEEANLIQGFESDDDLSDRHLPYVDRPQPVNQQQSIRQNQAAIDPIVVDEAHRLYLLYVNSYTRNTQSIVTQADTLDQDIELLASTEQSKSIKPVDNEVESIKRKIEYYKNLLRRQEIDTNTKTKIENFIAGLIYRLDYLKLQGTFNKQGMSVLEKKKKNIESCITKVGKDIMPVYVSGDDSFNTNNESECRSWNSEVHETRLVKISKKNSDRGKHNCYDIYGLIDNLYNKANLYLPQLDIYDMFEKTIYTFEEFKNLFRTIYESYSDYIFEKKYEILFLLVTLSDADLKKLYELVQNEKTEELTNIIRYLYNIYNFQYYIAYREDNTYDPTKSYWYQNIQKVNAILEA